MRFFTFLLLQFVFTLSLTAQDGKNVRGTVVDKDSKYPIFGASVVVVGSKPFIGTTTDVNGNFVLPQVPLGRASIKVSYIGFKDAFANDVLVMGGFKDLVQRWYKFRIKSKRIFLFFSG